MNIAIVGGGIAGMSLGYYLTKAGHRITVYEKEESTGGLARSFPVGGTYLEEYYHHIFTTDIHTIELIEEIGLKESLVWEESKMGLYCDGKVYAFGTPLDLLKFDPLSFIDKARFSFSTLYLTHTKDHEALEEITAEEFLLKNAGENAYRKIWEQLLATKFGEEDYKKITACWLQQRVSSRGKSKAGLFEREKLGYLGGSLKVLFDELEKRIKDKGGAVNKRAAVKKVSLDDNGKVIISTDAGDGGETFDRCCLCVPNPVIADITKELFDEGYIARLRSIKYRAELCAVLLIKGSLSPYYWLNISQKEVPFTGLMEHTNLISKDRYSENDIIYLSRYISPDEARYNMNSDELINLYSGHIKDIFPEFDSSKIRQGFIFRDLYAQPVVTRGHKERMPDEVSPVGNIFINNTSQIYPEDRGMSPGIRRSFELAGIVGGNEE